MAVHAAAKELLILPDGSATGDRWLWEHTRRVVYLAQLLALLPEAGLVADESPDATAAGVAAYFADAGWAVQVRAAELKPAEILSRPTNDMQRERGALALQERVGKLLPAHTVAIAAQAIRECNEKHSALPEARVLREAENLDGVGVVHVLRQFRKWQNESEGHGLEDLVTRWEQLLSYSFWDTVINLGLRWESPRRIARERLKAVAHFMTALDEILKASDLRRLVEDSGADTSAVFDPPP
jgi:hypothetical protein